MIAVCRLILVLSVLLPITIILIPVQFLALQFDLRLSREIPVFWHQLVVRLMGIRIFLKGNIPVERPMLIVANHTSWADIPVLASIMELCFIAKREVNTMPGAGLLARLQRTVFVTREDRKASGIQAKQISTRILNGDAMVLFAEGTTGNGNCILDFKSSLFGAAQYALGEENIESILIQPVAIAYTRLHGLPLGRHARGKTAWPGDIPLGRHALYILLKSAWDIEVSFGKPINFTADSRRRDIARCSRDIVLESFTDSIVRSGNT